MLQTAKLSVLDSFFNQTHQMVQIALRIKEPKRIPEIIDRLTDLVLGFHLSTNETNYFYKKRKVDPIFIPNFDDLEEAGRYMFQNHSPNFNECMGTLGANSDSIVINLSHACADGVYLLNLCDMVAHFDKQIPEYPKFPISASESFAAQIHSKSTEQCPDLFTNKNAIRIKTNPNIPPEKTSPFAKYVRIDIPLHEMAMYDAQTKKLKNLTENLWTSYILSASALNNNIDETGVVTCINMRQFLKPEQINWGMCNHYSSVTPFCEITENDTVAELGRRMRNDYNMKLKKGHQFSFLESLEENEDITKLPGFLIELSSIGKFKCEGLVEDVFVKYSTSDKACDPMISHHCFSIVSPQKSVFNGMFCYKSSMIDERTAYSLGKGVEFALRNITKDMKIGKAVDLVKEFQKKYNNM